MNLKIVLAICLLVLYSCQEKIAGNKEVNAASVYDKVLEDYSMHSYYIVVNIKSEGKEVGLIVVPNADLYNILHKYEHWDKLNYKKNLLQVLDLRDTLNVNLSSYNYLLSYRTNNMCDNMSNVDSADIRVGFFKENVLKQEFASDDTLHSCIIKKMFLVNVFMRYDDETGFLIID